MTEVEPKHQKGQPFIGEPGDEVATDPRLDQIVEVLIMSSARRVNLYLANGYRLLTIQPTALLETREGTPYVRRQPAFVMGLPQGVARFNEPAREPRPDGR